MAKNNILWFKVWAIASVQGAITLTWVVYNLYLPALLVKFGLNEAFATTILIVEHGLEAVIEPVFGSFSDRQQQRFGTRVPLIAIGTILSSALFIAMPALVILADPNQVGRWLFPIIAIAWATTMAIFRSPAMALLRNCAPTEKLPQAASILTLVAGIIGAFRFDIYGLILKLGEGFAFAIGSISLLAAAAFIRWFHPPQPSTPTSNQSESLSLPILALIFTTGIGISWGMRFLIPTLSNVFSLRMGEDYSKIGMTIFFIALGLAAVPAGKLGTKLGNYSGMLIGLAITIFCLQLLILIPNPIILFLTLIMLITAFSLVLNSPVPFALSLVPQQRSGLGVGLYFGGFGGGISLFNFVFPQAQQITINIGSIGSTVSFLLALLSIAFTMQLKIQEE
jgi:Na+/melibiose symporter-like transporter